MSARAKHAWTRFAIGYVGGFIGALIGLSIAFSF